ncbi:trehalose-phosphatase [Rathayibacter toxicus]|uniref:trehalose-phosphatase n=1 Tax=Rathayibacter toxicus TaxID=145458 RepID=UPI001C045E7D|nr:trehalose-phosphatase [Rathayibacter toxicus]QWL30597.1 trehalose-phosphatase [Rathayibacter toxicus]
MTERISDRLVEALRQLAATERLMVALDFDGTLAPEVDDPASARALPEARDAVLRLRELPATRVALVSGRALGSLEQVAQLPKEVLLVGSHGTEIRLDPGDDALSLTAKERANRGVLERILHSVARDLDNVWIEDKPAGFALHTRLATQLHSRIAHSAALARVRAEVDGVTIRSGKNVLEFSVRSATKGDAVEYLRHYTDATAMLYAGDDLTDEDAFAVLRPGDVGIKSGEGSTMAEFRVSGPEQLAHALWLVAEFRCVVG